MEYFEDIYAKNPAAMAGLDSEEDEVLDSDDPEVAEIERRLAAGEDFDKVLEGWGDGETKAGVESEEAVDDSYLGSASIQDAPLPSRPTKWIPKP